MGRPRFQDLLEAQWGKGRHVCVGLDSEAGKIPAVVGGDTPASRIGVFNVRIVSAVHEFVAAFKPNLAFYLAQGPEGLMALCDTIDFIHDAAPEAVVILDAKWGDIGNTNAGYVQFLDWCGADAVTVAPYMGGESLKPFLDLADKGVFVLCRTSNKGAGEFQDSTVVLTTEEGRSLEIPTSATAPLYQYVAYRVSRCWNQNGNCGLVVGATAPAELARVREIAPDVPILIPGVGAQGGELEASVKAARHRFLINSSRGIIFASKEADFAARAREEAEKLHNQITQALALVAKED